jgi:hypothetical protein
VENIQMPQVIELLQLHCSNGGVVVPADSLILHQSCCQVPMLNGINMLPAIYGGDSQNNILYTPDSGFGERNNQRL